MKSYAWAVLAVLGAVACGSSIEGDPLSSGGGGFATGGTSGGGTPGGGAPTGSDPNVNGNSSAVCGADAGSVCSGECCAGVCCTTSQLCCNGRCMMPTLDRPNCLVPPTGQ